MGSIPGKGLPLVSLRCAPAPGRSALPCHASLASRPGRLPSDSGSKQVCCAALRFRTLALVQAPLLGGSALPVVTLRSPRGRVAFPPTRARNRSAARPFGFAPSLWSRLPCSTAQRFPLSRFAPFATAHCSPLRRKCRRLCRPVFRSAGLAVYLLPGAQRFPLSRFACSQRAASLCLGLVFGPLCGPPLALAPVHPPCSRRLSASHCHASRPSRRHTARSSAENAAGFAGLFFGLWGSLCTCSRALSASPYRKFRPGRGERGWTWRRR